MTTVKYLGMSRERHQEGWVEETGKRVKKWKGHWFPYGADGQRHHTSRVLGKKSEMPKWEAKEKLRALIEKETGQKAKCDDQTTLQYFWEHRYLPARTWEPSTRSAVVSVVTLHLLPQLGSRKLSELDKFEMQQHLNALAESFSRSVVKKVRVQLGAVLDEAVEQELILKNPALKLKMPPTRKPCERYLSIEEYSALLAELAVRDQLIVRMAVTMGLRAGEMFALRWNDVEPERLRIDESREFRGKGTKETKTEDSDAYVRLPPAIAGHLASWRGHVKHSPAAFVFPTVNGTPLSGHNYERDVIEPAAIRAGLMEKRPKGLPKGARWRSKNTAVNFQAFRRTFSTWMQKTGATVKDVQCAMRHSSPDQTVRTYMKEIPASVATAVDALDRMLNIADVKTEGGVQ